MNQPEVQMEIQLSQLEFSSWCWCGGKLLLLCFLSMSSLCCWAPAPGTLLLPRVPLDSRPAQWPNLKLKGNQRQHRLCHARNLANATPGHDLDPVPPSTHRHPKSDTAATWSSRLLSSKVSPVGLQGAGLQTLMGILRIPGFAAPKTHSLTSLLSELIPTKTNI